MTDYGITSAGFNRKPLTAILEDINAAQRAAYGDAWDTGTSTPQGQLNGIVASALAELWELLEEAYHGTDPDAAADYLLTALAGLTGTIRRAATASVSARQVLNLEPGATVNAGALIAHSTRPDIVFALDETVTNDTLSTDDFETTATCQQTGPIPALAGSLTVIVNAVTGWNSTTNAEDASAGRDVDSDIVLRQRRELQLALRGGSTVNAIRADLLALEGVNSALVLENTTDATVDSLPPHSFEAVIDDGDTPAVADNVLAQTIWDSKPAGIATAGATTGTAVDVAGDNHLVNFSRVTLKPVYLSLALTTNADYPVDGDNQVKLALVTYGANTYGIDSDVIALALRAVPLQVAGVTDVPTFTLGFAPAPVGTTNLAVSSRERATFDSGDISL